MMIRSITVAAIFGALSLPARACMMEQPLTPQQMDKADVVFIGRAVAIGVPACTGGGCKNLMNGPRMVTFEIDKIIKGKKIKNPIEVNWQNGMFGEVDTVEEFRKRYGLRSKVGILLPETIKAHLRCGPRRGVTGDGKPVVTVYCETGLPLPFLPTPGARFDKPWIISDVCSPAFVEPVKAPIDS